MIGCMLIGLGIVALSSAGAGWQMRALQEERRADRRHAVPRLTEPEPPA